jgi:hypothetical protein
MLRVGAAIMGAVGGFFLAFLIKKFVFFWVANEQAQEIIFWTMAILLSGYLAYLSTKQYDNIIIFGTAIIGSYAFVRGISFFFPGSFPPESELFKSISLGSINPIFYTYVALFILTSIVGAEYQRRQSIKESKNNF